ncbi:hypothetical protein SLA2020_085450 [Shorea laevis]
MKSHAIELPPNGKNTSQNSFKRLFLTVTLIFFTSIPLYLIRKSQSPLPSQEIDISSLSKNREVRKKCDIFKGKWVPHPEGPYYTNETCPLIIDQHNCMKFGRPDTEFMRWRWKPDECELPYFDAVQFLELVRGKSMAFLGDSVGKNQMHSLFCLLSSVASPEDVSSKYSSDTTYFTHWFYADYNFTLASLWSPFLVTSKDADLNGYSSDSYMSLYLDEADKGWTGEIEGYDYVIISAGHWFFRPLYLHQKGQLVGCHKCSVKNITSLSVYHGYRMAFRTTFRTLLSLKSYKGVTFLRTFSPAHFENADWDKGGNCLRTRPFTNQERKSDDYIWEFYLTQVEEVRAAKDEGRKRGLQFVLLNTTEIMWLRPDGHPSQFGHSRRRNETVNDCVHWCLPGPIDIWNEFLLYMMKMGVLKGRERK